MAAEIVYFYDRICWPSMSTAWADGYAAVCPVGLDPIEWRASARRLARHLECRVRTGLRDRSSDHVVVAVANEGFPLGITDAYARDDWLRRRCDDQG